MTEVAIGAVTVACLVVLFLELALQARWNPRYFRFGILLFRQKVASTQSASGLEEDLSLTFERNFWSPLTFRQLGDEGIGFRERMSPFPLWLSYYLPLMHGQIRFAIPGRIEVIGRSNIALPLVWAVVMARILLSREPLLGAVLAAFLGVMYGLQAQRFQQVGRRVAASQERAA